MEQELFFLDTEFTSFENPILISIGIYSFYAKKYFYAESTDFLKEQCSDFTKDIVLPQLDGLKKTQSQMRKDLVCFLSQIKSEKIIVIDYLSEKFQFDYLCMYEKSVKKFDIIKPYDAILQFDINFLYKILGSDFDMIDGVMFYPRRLQAPHHAGKDAMLLAIEYEEDKYASKRI